MKENTNKENCQYCHIKIPFVKDPDRKIFKWHLADHPDESVKQYQEDIKAGVDVSNFQFINPITSNDPKAIEICEIIRQQLNKIPNDK